MRNERPAAAGSEDENGREGEQGDPFHGRNSTRIGQAPRARLASLTVIVAATHFIHEAPCLPRNDRIEKFQADLLEVLANRSAAPLLRRLPLSLVSRYRGRAAPNIAVAGSSRPAGDAARSRLGARETEQSFADCIESLRRPEREPATGVRGQHEVVDGMVVATPGY